MKSFVIILFIHCFASITLAFPLEQPIHYLPYSFGYQTADGQTRQEQSHNGIVTGSFSYTDANGDLRQVKYTADENGYRPHGDIGVDRRTAEIAAQMAALAPKGAISTSWTPSSSSSFQTFDKLIAPPPPPPPSVAIPTFHTQPSSIPQPPAPKSTSWNHFSSAASTANFVHASAPIIGPSGYQVDTPTHKIWVKY
ncbi:hypothetical protein DERP_007136 [Dermatophagoides pteronyssinus]|uniref:Uncharacterized protein n=1 Tax=Dermatophagoides pteronyssinus TaxID=6956 RepID=A0ABQ8JUD0_DERPT|nr:hypothetical protein DERP_007136 [Dermatophagoides pteronyssinus]